MNRVPWIDIAELVGVTAIVLSLLFDGLQLRQSQQVATEELVSYSNDRQNAIRELIVANADIWRKACAGEPLDPASRVVAAKIYDAWTDHVIGEYILRGSGVRQSESAQQQIVEEIAAQHWIYPGLAELAVSKRGWHGGAVETSEDESEIHRARFLRRFEDLESSDIKREGDPAWCGPT
ncbi:MAG: hypothetical protein OEQ14_17365 [Gammaproteobacteria bacterium]|nr:hypothetical protein [Gammaproteobacteria bacterium]